MDIYKILQSKPHSKRHLARYMRFIQTRRAKNKTSEKHHICPKAKDLFPEYGSFAVYPWNCINLTPREHYIAHLLLWKVYGGSQARAIRLMGVTKGSRLFESIRNDVRDLCKARRHTQETKDKIGKSSTGRAQTEETRIKIGMSKLGKKRKPFTEEAKLNMSLCRRGIPKSDEHKAKIAAARQRFEAQRRAAG